MKRRKGLFGRSKEGKPKKGQPSPSFGPQDSSSSYLERSINSSVHSEKQDVTQSPLLVAKAARNSEILLRNSLDVSLEVSNHSVSSSTIFVPVNEDSASVSIKSGRGSYGSLASIGGASPLIVGTPAPSVLRLLEDHDDEMKLSQQVATHGPLHGNQDYILNIEREAKLHPHGSNNMLDGENHGHENGIGKSFRMDDVRINIPPSMKPSSSPLPLHMSMQSNGNTNMFPMSMSHRPSARIIVDQLFKIDVNDFVRGERYLRLLRDALEVEGEDWQRKRIQLSFDPEETFLGIKQCAEKFHLRWMELKADRDVQVNEAMEMEMENIRTSNESDNTKINTIHETKLDCDSNGDGDGDGDSTTNTESRKLDGNGDGDSTINTESRKLDASQSSRKLDASQSSRKLDASQSSRKLDASQSSRTSSFSMIDEETWTELEQICWDIYEHAMWCCAVLASVCIGPAWNSQMKNRKARLQAAKFERLRNSQSQQVNNVSQNSVVSSVTTTIRPGRNKIITFQESIPRDFITSKGIYLESSSENVLEYPPIPEVLPISILRFVAWFGDAILPPAKYPEDVILLRRNNNIAENDDENSKGTVDLNEYSDSLARFIWEERRCLIRRQRLGEAQRELAAALVTKDYENDADSNVNDVAKAERSATSRSSRRYTLSIPGSHEPMCVMVKSWVETALLGWPHESARKLTSQLCLNIDSESIRVGWGYVVKNGALDWWNAVHVSKTVADLTLAGWRPPPDGVHGEQCMIQLMILAETGTLLRHKDMKSSTEYSSNQKKMDVAREERLAAATSAADAMIALNHLGTRGCLPPRTVKTIATSLSYLLSVSDGMMSGNYETMFPIPREFQSDDEELKVGTDLDEFLRLRDICLNEIAELLWSMMARNSSMSLTTDALLGVLDIDLSLDDDHSIDDSILAACGAVRSLGASLWGNLPLVQGNQSLRIFWGLFIDLLSKICASLHDRSTCCKSPIEALATATPSSFADQKSDFDSFTTIPELRPTASYNPLSLGLVLEIAVAVRRLVDGDLASEHFILCPQEWESLVSLLELGFLPWLASVYSANNDPVSSQEEYSPELEHNRNLVAKIQGEVLCIFQNMQIYLGFNEGGVLFCHQILDEEVRKRFFLLYFRMISPLLPISESIQISLSIIDSWVRGGAITFSAFEWQKKCSELLTEAFAMYQDVGQGYGGYVHPPLVRQAAMRVLVESIHSGPGLSENQSISSPGNISEETDPTSASFMAKNIHADAVCRILVPYLECLFGDSDQIGLRLPDRYPVLSNKENYGELHRGNQKLLLSAVQITGDLLCSFTLNNRERLELIKVLRHCTLFSTSPSQRVSSNGLLGNVLEQNEWGEMCKVKLEAVGQLGLFLRTSFDSHAAPCVPSVVDIFIEAVNAFYYNSGSVTSILPCQIVCIAAMVQLACLRTTKDNRAYLVDENDVLKSLSPSIANVIQRVKFVADVIGSHDDVDDIEIFKEFDCSTCSSFQRSVISSRIKLVKISDERKEEPAQKKSPGAIRINISAIIDAISEVLAIVSPRPDASDSSQYVKFVTDNCDDLTNVLHSLTYEMLDSYIQSGLDARPLGLWNDLSSMIQPGVASLSQCKFLSSCAAFIAEKQSSTIEINFFFKRLLSGCASDDFDVSRVACLGLSSFLTTCSSSPFEGSPMPQTWYQEACTAIVARIQLIMDSKIDMVGTLLGTLLHMISTYQPGFYILHDRTKANIVILCHQLCSEDFDRQPFTHIYILSLQCASMAVSTMGMDELKNLIPRISARRGSLSYSKGGAEVPEQLQFASAILDILVQHCLVIAGSSKVIRRSSVGVENGGVENRSRGNAFTSLNGVELNEIERVAKEINDIDTFVVDEEDGQNVGAWLCNDILLVCRVGSRESKHRGWVEIILRSPSTRVRKLVRLTNEISLQRPDLPSTLWNAASTQPEDNMVPNNESSRDISRPDSEELIAARNALSRFNAISLQSDSNIPARHVHRQDSNRISVSRSSDHGAAHSDNGFQHFLHGALDGDKHSIKQVQDVLHELDGSIPILDAVYDFTDEPIALKWCSNLRRAVNILDRTSFLQTHKVSFSYFEFLYLD